MLAFCLIVTTTTSLVAMRILLVVSSNIITQELVLHEQVLFNDTIYHNIHYGRLSATKEEVYMDIMNESSLLFLIICKAYCAVSNLPGYFPGLISLFV